MNFADDSYLKALPNLQPQGRWVTAYLGLGANIGEPVEAIRSALALIDESPDIVVRKVSSLYRTAPIGLTAQPDFVNAVARLETRLPPEDLLSTVLNIENLLGRVRTERWAPRVIDVDVLLYGRREISTPEIAIPHPRMHERAFVLVPLAEIDPNLRIPGYTETVAERAAVLAAETRIERIADDLAVDSVEGTSTRG